MTKVTPKPKQTQPKQKPAQTPAKTLTAKAKPLPKKTEKKQPPQPVPATPRIPVPERIGLTAGDIWHYLAEQGPTPVNQLVKALPEEEKIIQRSIGWLAQEDKITIDTTGRIETIALK